MSWLLYNTGLVLCYLNEWLPDFSLVFVLACLVTRYLIKHNNRRLPPGPMSLPFIGYLPFLGQRFHLTLTRLSKCYGPVYQIYLGAKRVVILSDPNLIREAFRQPVFSGRPDTELTKLLQGYGKSFFCYIQSIRKFFALAMPIFFKGTRRRSASDYVIFFSFSFVKCFLSRLGPVINSRSG